MAVLVAGWHLPLFFMPVFEAPLIGFVTTLALTFWYAWLLNHASGSVLITLIAHGTEGAVETNDLGGPVPTSIASTSVCRRVVPGRARPGGAAPPVLDPH